jgi:glycine reductase
MKVMMIFDQTQAGLGGKESPDLPMGGKAMGIGSCEMFTRFLDQQGGKVIANFKITNKLLKFLLSLIPI